MIGNLHLILKASLLSLFLLAGVSGVYAQERVISGIVTDAETGETLIGVNVYAPHDRSLGTITDIDGHYQLSVPDTLTSLSFSYVGYTTQTLAITEVMNVELYAGEQLSEVVIVGYGTQKTKEVTSAITRVKSDNFNDGNVLDPIQLVQGTVAGLSFSRPGGDPNADFDIRLRGLSTFGSNTEPLIIVDGIQGNQDLLNSLDPNDVASFDVLKDASAAAIYGTRAASGVIIITTKRGEYVPGDKDFNVEFSASLTSERVAKQIDVLSPEDYLAFSNSTDFEDKTDWMDKITQNGFAQAYNLSANGATKNSNYRVGFSYRSANGVVGNTGFNQINGRINFTQRALNDMLTLDFKMSATLRTEEYSQSEALTFTARYNPTAPIQADDDFSQEWGGYFQREAFSFYNPLAIIEQGVLDGKKTFIVGSIKATLEPISGLKFSGFYSANYGSEFYGSYWSKSAYWTPYAVGSHNGFARREDKLNFLQLFEFITSYDHRWDKFSMNLLGGYSYQEKTYDELWAFGEGFLSDGFTYNSIGTASVNKANKETMHTYKSGSTLIGFFGRGSFNWDNTFFLTGSLRRDGSTMFGENNQWGNFPGVSAGVDFAKLFDIPGTNRLKLRGGYGVTGNLPGEPYLSQLRFNVSDQQFFYNGDYIQAFAPVRNANPDLKWEVKKEFDIGIDFFFLDYRLGGSIDYYKSNSEDLLLEYRVPVPPFLSDRMWLNLGELENSGLEIAVNYKIFTQEKFKWSTDVVFTKYFDTRLVKITSDLVETEATLFFGDLGAPFLTNINSIKLEEGGLVGEIIAPIYLGIDSTGKLIHKDVNGDSTFNAQEDYEVVGNGLPDFEFGWGNSFDIGKFNIRFFLRGVIGHSLVNVNNARYGVPVVMGIQSGMNLANDFKEAVDGPVFSDVHVEKADYVRLDNFSLGYTFDFPDSKYVSHLKLFFSGQNLFTITNYSGVVPDVRYGDSKNDDNPLAPGIDREKTYFSTRSFTLGVSVLF